MCLGYNSWTKQSALGFHNDDLRDDDYRTKLVTLFIEDDQGTTAFDCLVNKKGVEKAMALLHDILTPDCLYPILHHVFINARQHKDLFKKIFFRGLSSI